MLYAAGMELTFIWSWFSFIVGIFVALAFVFWLLVAVAFSQWKKQRDAAKTFSFRDLKDSSRF